jgi:hypothetical protein
MKNRPRLVCTALAFSLLLAGGLHAADLGLKNGDFFTGKQFWRGNGKIVTLPDGNKVIELTSNTRDIDTAYQELKLGALPEVEVKFRARFLGDKGQMRARLIRSSGRSTFFTFTLPPDGVWRDVSFKYTRESLKDERTLSLETLPYVGKLQIDDVWAGEPGTHVSVRPMEEPTALKPATPGVPMVPAPAVPGTAPRMPTTPPVAPATAPRPNAELDGFLDALPENLRLPLNDSALPEESLAAINAWFAKEMLNKTVQITFAIHSSEVVPNEPEKFRLRAADGLLSGKYALVRYQQFYAYLPSASATEIAKEPIGATVTLSARIGRCDLKQFPAGVRLNVDVMDSVWIKKTDAPK